MNQKSRVLFLFCFLGYASFAQEIQYATGRWNREGLGNQRAVIQVESNADAVRVRIPWRRKDNQPEKKDLILTDASTGKRITNLFRSIVNQEFGEIIFQPVTGKGLYYLYYLPSRNTGNWWLPTASYQPASETSSPDWLKKNRIPTPDALFPEATVLRFESVSDEHSFFPMGIPATESEKKKLIEQHNDKAFIVFTEDRKFPIQTAESIPFRWVQHGTTNQFSGTALRNEFYVFQLGVYASKKDLTDVRLQFTSLKDSKGNEIPAQALRCFNLGGKDWLGKSFSKKVSVAKNQLQPLWIGIDIPSEIAPGDYHGTVEVHDGTSATEQVKVTIQIKDETVANRGYDDLARLARLNWLDSGIGLDDRVVKPYTPVRVEGRTVHILGRSLTVGKEGFPTAITSTYTADNSAVNGSPKPILGAPMCFSAIERGKALTWTSSKPVITHQSDGAAYWKVTNRNATTDLVVAAKMEYDGYINYTVTLTPRKTTRFDDLQLLIPYAKAAAVYQMGMGKKGGLRPDKWEWKWEADKANNMVWLGGVNAGMQCKLKHEVPDWKIYGFDETGPYKDWSNNGSGGCVIEEKDGNVVLRAFTGAKTVEAGQTLHFNFGLLITPLKPLDNEHWNQRYFQADPPVTSWMSKAVKGGANIMNIHQGNALNPYINYPFAATEPLKAYINQAKRKGIRSKLYYTVRELSVTNTAELWPLLSLGDEVFTRGIGTQLADQFSDKPETSKKPTGATWLTEHLIKGYDPAWHNPLESGEMDISIRTTGLSRWHNYYLEGLGWLVKNTGMKGIYLDGVGYDREIMKRVRKVMDNAADSCLIDFHSGNNFDAAYGLNSPANQYMELFPSVNSLWLGEGYDYGKETDDYWLVEISGIPLGLYSEMLQHCGHFYKGMVYGMTSRLGWTNCNPALVWKFWDDFGIQKSTMKGYWNTENPVTTTSPSIKTTTYQRENEVIVAVASWSQHNEVVDFIPDWKKLGMDPEKVVISAPDIPGYQEGNSISSLEKLPIKAGQGIILSIKKQN